MIITHEWLEQQGACYGARETCREVYPDGVPVTEAAALRLAESGVDVLWVVPSLLTPCESRKAILSALQRLQRKAVRKLRKAGFEREAERLASICFRAVKTALAAEKDLIRLSDTVWRAYQEGCDSNDTPASSLDALHSARAAVQRIQTSIYNLALSVQYPVYAPSYALCALVKLERMEAIRIVAQTIARREARAAKEAVPV